MRKELTDVTEIRVKFSEMDAMLRVWHGNYVKYFEDGRESFGRHYPGIGYEVMLAANIPAPVYDVHVRHLAPLGMNDIAVIHTTYIRKPGARLDFKYQIFRQSDGVLCCEGSTTQLFIDPQGQLLLEEPQYFIDWKKKYL
jgi:acyl-CoA thioester hydrolase